MILADAMEFSDVLAGFIDVTISEIETWSFGEEEDAESQDERPGEADADGDTPGSSVGDGFCAEVDEVGEENTDGDEELVAAVIVSLGLKEWNCDNLPNNSTTNVSWRALSLVHRYEHRQTSNSETSDNATNHHFIPLWILCSDLDDISNDENHAPSENTESSSNFWVIGDRRRNQSAEKRSDGKHSNNQTRSSPGKGKSWLSLVGKIVQEVLHLKETTDLFHFTSVQPT